MALHQRPHFLRIASTELARPTARAGYLSPCMSSSVSSAVYQSTFPRKAEALTIPCQKICLIRHGRQYHTFPGQFRRSLPLSDAISSSKKPRYLYKRSANCSIQTRWNSENSSSKRVGAGEGDSLLRSIGFEEITATLPSTSPSSPKHKPSAILIDVREPAELSATGIIPGAVAIPLASQPDAYFLSPDEFETRFGFSKPGMVETGVEEGDIIFYCRAGVRARAAAQLAVQAGYDPARIAIYDGSWLDWSGRGGMVEKWEGNE